MQDGGGKLHECFVNVLSRLCADLKEWNACTIRKLLGKSQYMIDREWKKEKVDGERIGSTLAT